MQQHTHTHSHKLESPSLLPFAGRLVAVTKLMLMLGWLAAVSHNLISAAAKGMEAVGCCSIINKMAAAAAAVVAAGLWLPDFCFFFFLFSLIQIKTQTGF